MIGQTLGSYSIQRELGRGGMGAVFVGVHALLGRNAAVKVLLPDLSRNQDVVQRFFNEARAASAIKHPGIVEIYDFGFSPDGSAFIVMEFLEGESLASRLKRLGRLTPAFTLAVARQVATALAVAHRAGIVHRDLKPDNIFLVPDGEIALGERIKLLDFGIAKLAGDAGLSGGMARTSTGAIMGTPYYMSPEQCRGAGEVDARSDLYALGCMIYEMLCGRVPFVSAGAGDIIAAHLLLPPQPLRELAPDVPPAIEALVMRLLAKSPADRPQSAEATAQELAALAHGAGLATSAPAIAVAPAPMTAPVTARPAASTTLGNSAGQELATPAAAPRRTALLVGGALALVVAAVVVVMLATGGDGRDAAARPTAGSGDARVAVVVADAGATLPDVSAALATARAALASETWLEAERMANQVLDAEPGNADALAIRDQARRETAAQLASKEVEEAVAARNAAAALAAFARIPAASSYRAWAQSQIDQARTADLAATTTAIAALVKGHKCTDADEAAAAATTLWGEPASPLQAAADKCKASGSTGSAGGVAVAPKPPKPPKPPRPRPEPCAGDIYNCPGGPDRPQRPDLGEPDEEKTAQAWIDEAGAALERGQHAKAMKAAESALKLDPGNDMAAFIAGMAACNLKQPAKARRYMAKAGSRASSIQQACARAGVALDDAASGGY